MNLDELILEYQKIKPAIQSRLEEFKRFYENADDPEIFAEMAFCLLTPQSKAKVCWTAISKLKRSGVLYSGDASEILPFLKGVRFSERKAQYIVMAREMFYDGKEWHLKETLESFDDVFELRDWLVANVKGYGYKEASHFLRNVGKGGELAILDRHILKNLKRFGVIEEIPKSLSRSRYLYIENKMREFSKRVGIPMDHLDLLFWYLQTGEVFK